MPSIPDSLFKLRMTVRADAQSLARITKWTNEREGQRQSKAERAQGKFRNSSSRWFSRARSSFQENSSRLFAALRSCFFDCSDASTSLRLAGRRLTVLTESLSQREREREPFAFPVLELLPVHGCRCCCCLSRPLSHLHTFSVDHLDLLDIPSHHIRLSPRPPRIDGSIHPRRSLEQVD